MSACPRTSEAGGHGFQRWPRPAALCWRARRSSLNTKSCVLSGGNSSSHKYKPFSLRQVETSQAYMRFHSLRPSVPLKLLKASPLNLAGLLPFCFRLWQEGLGNVPCRVWCSMHWVTVTVLSEGRFAGTSLPTYMLVWCGRWHDLQGHPQMPTVDRSLSSRGLSSSCSQGLRTHHRLFRDRAC